MRSKQFVREVLERLPDDCSIDDVQYHLYVAETLEHRREAARSEELVSQEIAESRLKKWLIK